MFAEAVLRANSVGFDKTITRKHSLKKERNILKDWHVDLSHVNLYDGSGLSRSNHFTPVFLASTLRAAYLDPKLGKRYSAVSGYFAAATAAIEEMVRQTGPFQIDQEGIMQSGVIIRHLILPGNLKNTYHIIRYVAEHFQPGEVFFSLMSQYLPCGKVSDTQFPEINRKLSRSEYLRAEKWLLNSGIEDGFLQDRNSASNDFIPDFNGFGA